MIPKREECLKLLEENNLPQGLLNHIFLVNKVAVFISQKLKTLDYKINLDLIDRASLLHDLDKILIKENNHNHTEITTEILKENNWQELIGIISKHFAESVLNKKTYPETLEEKIVYYADKIGNQKIVDVEERMKNWVIRYPEFTDLAKKVRPHILKIEKEILDKLKMNFDQLKVELEKSIRGYS